MGLSFEGLQHSIVDVGGTQVATDVGPSLEVFNNQLWAAWKGSGGDERIWYSSTVDSGNSWTAQQSMRDPVRTSVRPSLAAGLSNSLVSQEPVLYAAWKGGGDDERLWWSNLPAGGSWGGQQQIIAGTEVKSSFGPSLAASGGQLLAAWKGSSGDERLWSSSFNVFEGFWTTQQLMFQGGTQFLSSVGPSVTFWNDRFWAAWKGSSGDERLWYSFTSDFGLSWAPQREIVDAAGTQVLSSVGPSLTIFNGRLYAAWKGGGGDERMWYLAAPDDRGFVENQEPLPGPLATSVGPSIVTLPTNDRLYFAWKGGGGDDRIWWTSATDR